MYKLLKDIDGNVFGASKTENSFTVSFLFDPANTDYQEYLEWLAEGNTPAPPDEPESP